MLCTTLNRIREHKPCEEGWRKLLAGLGKTSADDEPLPYARIVEISGIDDALWACRVEPQYAKEWRLFAVWCARQVEHLMKDERSRAALDVAELYANGQATDKELTAAWLSAEAAACDAAIAANYAEWNAARAASWAVAGAAALAAIAVRAEREAAMAAARAASWAVAGAAAIAVRTEGEAAGAAQTKKFLEIVGER